MMDIVKLLTFFKPMGGYHETDQFRIQTGRKDSVHLHV